MEGNNEMSTRETIVGWLRKIHPIAWVMLFCHTCTISLIYLTSTPRSPETAFRLYYVFLFGMGYTVLQPWLFCVRYFRVIGRNTHKDVQKGCIGILVCMVVFVFVVGVKACTVVDDYNYDLNGGWFYIRLNAGIVFLSACLALYTILFTFKQASKTPNEDDFMYRLYVAQNKYFNYH